MMPSSRRFVFEHQVRVQPRVSALELWIPVPRSDPYQRVMSAGISSPVELSSTEDRVHRNRILHGVMPCSDDEQTMSLRYDVERFPRLDPSLGLSHVEPLSDADLASFLAPDSHVPVDGPVVEEAIQKIP